MQKIRLDYTGIGIVNRLEKIRRKVKQRKENNTYRREVNLRRILKNYYCVNSKFIKGKMCVIINRMEKRLDIIIVRMMLAKSIYESRQLITHGKVLINGKIINIPSIKIKVGEIIEVKRKEPLEVTSLMKRIINIPEYLEVNYRTCTGIKIREPRLNEISMIGIINRVIRIN